MKDILNLQYNGSDTIRDVVCVFIRNVSGYTNIKKRCSPLNRVIQIPVDNPRRGSYDLSIVIKDEVVWNQRLVK